MREYGVHCARLFVRLRLCANGARDDANVTRRSHYQKSLLRDNDRAVFRAKLETIYVDWIALLRRLLIYYNWACLYSLECIFHAESKYGIENSLKKRFETSYILSALNTYL